MTFTVAIVGRPNVGKSTLFNRLAGRRLALVDDQPGLTRDRREADAELGACTVRLIDTAGLERGDEGLTPRMRSQTEAAIAQADLVLFLVDARTGIVPADEMFADLVRGADRKVILAANKCEGRAAEPGLYEAYSLGLGEPLPISAEHGLGIGDLADAIEQACKQAVAVAEAPDGEGLAAEEGEAEGPHKLRIAVVGRPNVGKSTLVNALLGEERMITGPEAGITRDAVAVDLAFEGRPLLLFDTAGLRRKMRVEGRAEVNKWDLVRDRARRLRELQETCQRLLPQLRGVALVPVSACKGQGLDALMRAVLEADALWNRRLPTHALNDWLRTAVEAHAPPAVSGRRIKLRYITQANARPPTFVLFCSRPKALPDSYLRYLVNGLRETFDMPGVPIRLHLRKGDNPYA